MRALRKSTAEAPTFEGALREAVTAARALAALDAPGSGARKLSARAFLELACRHAGKPVAEVEALAGEIAAAPVSAVHAAVRRVAHAYASANYSTPVGPARVGILRYLVGPDGEAEGAANGWGLLLLGALGAHEAVRRHPERFGEAESLEAESGRRTALTLERQAAEARARAACTLGDLVERSGGRACFRLADTIPLLPLASAIERLVAHLASDAGFTS